ncbi:hypothetical protein PAI11_31600 [Patulibacter medicamentivorans]|uniref:Uncharacterized protein n=1 Tax=Patulibacter medicamentivorans TaxID=1097667 RepID=H0E8J9_9ACTN|nr:hypothetical protein PAI11_31600 [Patulibacter medicamentivorans]
MGVQIRRRAGRPAGAAVARSRSHPSSAAADRGRSVAEGLRRAVHESPRAWGLGGPGRSRSGAP